jgi:hypothetical protein
VPGTSLGIGGIAASKTTKKFCNQEKVIYIVRCVGDRGDRALGKWKSE